MNDNHSHNKLEKHNSNMKDIPTDTEPEMKLMEELASHLASGTITGFFRAGLEFFTKYKIKIKWT